MRCGTIGSCQSAATSEIVKALPVTSLTHVSGAIASVQTFTFLARVTHAARKFSPTGRSLTHYINALKFTQNNTELWH